MKLVIDNLFESTDSKNTLKKIKVARQRKHTLSFVWKHLNRYHSKRILRKPSVDGDQDGGKLQR